MTRHVSSTWLTAVLALAGTPIGIAQDTPPAGVPAPILQETESEHDQRMQWFREARFGMFIHWGLYSQLAGEWQDRTVSGGAEWIQLSLGIPSSEYSSLAKTWNPTAYEAREWVRLMKAAGVRYICITSKHHDGFCLWPTALNDNWNVSVTPHGKDLLAPLADACREEGIKFCLYHSVLDWHHPDWPSRPAINDSASGTPDKERFKKDYLFPQLKELLSNYGEIGMLWLDGTWDEAWTSADGRELEAYIRTLQPSLVLNNRSGYIPPQPEYDFHIGNTYSYISAGDYISPEGEVPPTGLPGLDWETCQTMQLPNNWGYNRLVGFRSFGDLLRQLVDVSSKGGNLLLNVGPDAGGEILPQAAACLEKFATWMAVNADSIHGTSASPFERLPFDGRCTQKPGVLYLHVFSWPKDGRLVVPVRNTVKRAYLLAEPRENGLDVETSDQGVVLTLPKRAPDPLVSVVVVEIEGEPEVVPPPPNLAGGKPVEVSSAWPGRPHLTGENITDGDPGSMWAAEETARTAWVKLDLQEECVVSGALLSDAPYGRTQAFTLEARVGGEWRQLARGATIGSQRLLTFPPVTARVFRLTLDKTSDTPTLADFQLFGDS